MPLTEDQQAFLIAQNESNAQAEASRLAANRINARLETVRLAKETLIENARTKPVNERDISADDITTFADTLLNYINS